MLAVPFVLKRLHGFLLCREQQQKHSCSLRPVTETAAHHLLDLFQLSEKRSSYEYVQMLLSQIQVYKQ